MRLTFILILIVLVSGCTVARKRQLISPSDFLYYQGNMYYEERNFAKAIELYKKLLKRKPNSELATPAKLNLGMAYYYTEFFKDAYTTLKDVKVEDANMKIFVDKILEVSRAAAVDEIALEEAAQAELAAKKSPTGIPVRITVTDVYLDDYGSVLLTGTTDKKATVSVNGETATIKENNTFTASFTWKKGTAISIAAKNEDGDTGELNYFPDSEPPLKPENLRVINSSSNSIEIEWDENSEEDIRGYKLYYRLKGGALQEVQEIIEEKKYEIVGLQNYTSGSNRTFEFYLRAVDRMYNESEDSDILETDLP